MRFSFGVGFQNYKLPEIEKRPYVLDIDLDAFSCCKALTNSEHKDPSEDNYITRIQRTIETLSRIYHKPELIIIAKSQERSRNNTYISSKYVRPVKKNLIKQLKILYK